MKLWEKNFLITYVTFLILLNFVLGFLVINAFSGDMNKEYQAAEKDIDNIAFYVSSVSEDKDFPMKISRFNEIYRRNNAESDSSIDTRFELTMNHFGKIKHDSYIDDVGGAMATYTRLDEEYRKQVDKVIGSKDFPFNTTTVFGTVNVGKNLKALTFDKVYTPEELGTQYGKIVIYLENKSVSIRSMKTALLELKTYFDSKDLYFRVIDLTLQGSAGSAKSIAIQNFSYTDITNEGLAKKLKKAVEDLQKYYEEQDKLKDAGVV